MHLAEEELRKEVSKISVNRLESLLHLSVQTSSSGSDPYKVDCAFHCFCPSSSLLRVTLLCLLIPWQDDVSLEFSSYNLVNHLELIHSRSDASTLPPSYDGGSKTIFPNVSLERQQHTSANSGNKVLVNSLLGIDCIMVTYRVTWPLSLVVSKRAITKYQLLFRHLFFTKHVERMLLHTWLDHQASIYMSCI